MLNNVIKQFANDIITTALRGVAKDVTIQSNKSDQKKQNQKLHTQLRRGLQQ